MYHFFVKILIDVSSILLISAFWKSDTFCDTFCLKFGDTFCFKFGDTFCFNSAGAQNPAARMHQRLDLASFWEGSCGGGTASHEKSKNSNVLHLWAPVLWKTFETSCKKWPGQAGSGRRAPRIPKCVDVPHQLLIGSMANLRGTTWTRPRARRQYFQRVEKWSKCRTVEREAKKIRA